MTKQQLGKALALAQSKEPLEVSTDLLFGSALPGFKPVYVTLDVLAKFVRYQVICLDGSIDQVELNDLAHYLQNRAFILEA